MKHHPEKPVPSTLQAPYIISSVAAQKKNPARCSVFLNGEFAFGCTIDTAVRFNLIKGREISQPELVRLQEQEDIIILKQTALRYATYKSRTSEEVRRKMLEKDFAPEEAEYAVQFLEEFGYVDDSKYALAFIYETMKRKPAGESRLRQELLKRGVSKHVVEDALTQAFPPETSRETALELALAAAQKKIRSLERKDPSKRKQALVGYLQRQGFSWAVIKNVLAEVLQGDADDDD